MNSNNNSSISFKSMLKATIAAVVLVTPTLAGVINQYQDYSPSNNYDNKGYDVDRYRGDNDKHKWDNDRYRGDNDKHKWDNDRYHGDDDKYKWDNDYKHNHGKWCKPNTYSCLEYNNKYYKRCVNGREQIAACPGNKICVNSGYGYIYCGHQRVY
ncbi:hypothetical protein BB560_004345 [Smittium megazygosporum]|uniref:Carbohydrate-binding module family 19 domain-containing protein n=1 Tax=Smittium megazygosporum TaxID=133381 RepID=A0A2T9Z9G6_9FUNG|nr:hypothetical protein BB560_004345 [Smittium megazygosporum]